MYFKLSNWHIYSYKLQLVYMRSSNHEGCGVAKEIIEVIGANEGKKVKWRRGLKNKLIT